MNTQAHPSESPEILFHLRWVAKIAMAVGAMATVGLAVMLGVLTDDRGESYGALIQSHSVAQYRLGPALLVGGLFLLALAAVLTWLITLYSSFRIAGPLFRLSRNLEIAITQWPAKSIPLRASDRLQSEAALLEDGFRVLATHYEGLHQEVHQALLQLEAGGTTANERLAICARLKQHLDHAHR